MANKVSWRVPRGRLFQTPVPPETRTYKPVSHKELTKVTLTAIKEAGFKLKSQEYSTARDGLVANARYVIADVGDDEMRLEIGWQNSYDKTLSLKFAIGTRILVCANGCVSGNFGSFKKKHMGDVQEFSLSQIAETISEAREIFAILQAERDRMKEVIITKKQQAELIGRLFLDEQIIGSTQLNIIKDELAHPTHDYKSPNSIWELYQYTTFSMKELHPRLWIENHISVHDFFTKAVEEFSGVPITIELEEVTEEGIVVDDGQIDLEDAIAEAEQEDSRDWDKAEEDGVDEV